MTRRFTTLAVMATLALGFGLAAPAGNAAAMGAAGAARTINTVDAAPLAVEQAQYRERGRHWQRERDWRQNRRHWDRGRDYRRHYRPNSGIYFHFGTPAPRYHAPAPRRHYGLSRAHVSWCHARYRSYRAWDNTFQPYNGPRRQCRSPYA